MTDLHEIYRMVCEKRAEAAAMGLELQIVGKQHGWWHNSTGFIPDFVAEALIVAHWLTLIPTYAVLWRTSRMKDGEVVEGPDVWRVGSRRTVIEMDEPCGDSPFLALAAYLERTP